MHFFGSSFAFVSSTLPKNVAAAYIFSAFVRYVLCKCNFCGDCNSVRGVNAELNFCISRSGFGVNTYKFSVIVISGCDFVGVGGSSANDAIGAAIAAMSASAESELIIFFIVISPLHIIMLVFQPLPCRNTAGL